MRSWRRASRTAPAPAGRCTAPTGRRRRRGRPSAPGRATQAAAATRAPCARRARGRTPPRPRSRVPLRPRRQGPSGSSAAEWAPVVPSPSRRRRASPRRARPQCARISLSKGTAESMPVLVDLAQMRRYKEGGLARGIAVWGLVVCAALLFAGSSAGEGEQSYFDATGERPGALDIGRVLVHNGDDGKLELLVGFAGWDGLPSDADVVVGLDTDRNASTGDANGWEYVVRVDGKDFTSELLPAGGDVELASFPGIGLWIQLSRSEIANASSFAFAVTSRRGADDARIVDRAPESGTWTYRLVLKPVIVSISPRFAPAQPRAGRDFVVDARVTLESGSTVPATDVRCVAKLAGTALRGTGPGRCSFAIPKTAKGKRLALTLKAGYEEADAATLVKTLLVR